MSTNKHLGTLCVQAGYEPGNGEPRQIPIIQSTTFKYASSDEMGKLFDLEAEGYFYTRLQNPTNDRVAARLCALEGGVAAMLTSSGQAANFFACFNICEAGDHMISTASIYGGTFNLFNATFRKMGIEVTFVDQDASDEAFEKAFKPNTKLVFGETLSNPGVKVLDIERIAKIAHRHGVPFIIDNTFPTPVKCRPFEWGADIVTHSTTKYIDGHGSSVGGAIVDSGNFDWSAHADKFPGLTTPDPTYHGLVYTEQFGKGAYITKATSQLMRDFGSIQSPQNAYYIGLGLQSLKVRMDRHCSSALQVARYLHDHPAVKWIHYPDLEDDPYHGLQQKYLPEGSCGVMAICMKAGREFTKRFMDHLKLITIETHVADAYTCVLHPASHTHRQLTDEQLKAADIDPGLVRLSVGLEDPEDLIADIDAALEAAAKG
jgi:O-acetylhomoserine (thiol)-lyase